MGQVHYDFADETAIVTGGASGIGRSIALGFANANADATVIVADQQAEPKDPDADLPTHETIEESGGTAEFVETDVSEPDQVRLVVEAARD